ncbi:MAG TPA: helix-turn-helix domain-containing protein [Leucothrix sp.]|nr:helix-turn-helix domain-containing protein [Leucothrix sp.]
MAKDKNKNEIIAQAGDLRALLLQYRDSAGFTSEQMATALCLSESVINNLESEEFHLLAEPPYVRGYIRNYAKQADADSSNAVRIYEVLRGANPDELDYHIKVSPSMHQSTKSMSPILSQLALLSLLIAGLLGLFMIPAVNQWVSNTWDSFSRQTREQSSIANDKPSLIGTMPTPIPLKNQTQDQKNRNKTTPPSINKEIQKENKNTATLPITDKTKTTEDSPKESIKKTEGHSDASSEQQTQNLTDDKPTLPETSGKDINIKLVFTKEVWMRIKDANNKTVYEGQTAAGQERTLKLEKPLTFRVGNAQGLSLFVNGKPVDISQYIQGSIANFTLK